MKIKFILCGLSVLICSQIISESPATETHEFYGRHFVASYKECDVNALTDISALMKVLTDAVNSSGATILQQAHETFPGNGMTAFFVLSESHASIHTYPEHNACFVDLFTCGHNCSYEKFDEILRTYLKASIVDKQVHIRT